MNRMQRIALLLVAGLTLVGTVACICCPLATDIGGEVSTPAVQAPTKAPGQPEPTKPAQPPTGGEPTAVPMGSTAITSFRFMFETSSADESKMSVEGALTPKAMYLKTSTTEAGGTPQESEIYYIDNYMYTKDPTGGWQKIEFDLSQALSMMQVFDFNKLLKEAQDAGDLTMSPVGIAEVRGVSCMKYEFTSKDPDSVGKGFIYLGIADGLIYRVEGDSTNDEGVAKIFMEYWDYNKDFVIEPPI